MIPRKHTPNQCLIIGRFLNNNKTHNYLSSETSFLSLLQPIHKNSKIVLLNPQYEHIHAKYHISNEN
jgi:hypothetical protein